MYLPFFLFASHYSSIIWQAVFYAINHSYHSVICSHRKNSYNRFMRKSTSGFTIVELLIVVVVIGILAAIVIVAYNGITQEAKNSKTVSAVNTYLKALRLYEVEKGSLPNINSCLGTTTTYPDNGLCWDGTSWDVETGFLNALSPYISSYPEPDTSQVDSNNPQRRGAFHYWDSGAGIHRIYMMLLGSGDCPTLTSGEFTSRSTVTNGIVCRYALD
tara:strand:+ start:1566 stop:2213 length:648 start_codon:yes stop_codon:yes gene_type:complete